LNNTNTFQFIEAPCGCHSQTSSRRPATVFHSNKQNIVYCIPRLSLYSANCGKHQTFTKKHTANELKHKNNTVTVGKHKQQNTYSLDGKIRTNGFHLYSLVRRKFP